MGGALLSDKGLDTVRFRWRMDNQAYEGFSKNRLMTRGGEGYSEGHRGERYVQTPLGRVGVYRDGLVYMEGRAAALEAADPENHDLLDPVRITLAEQVARDLALEVGAPLDDQPARLGRVDLASELRFSDDSEGSAFLHSLGSLDVPWCKSRVDGRKGDRIETVSFHGTRGKTIYLRAYDKGVEAGTDPPGNRIRVERQKRYRKDREIYASELNVFDLRRAFLGREFQSLVNLPSATVCDLRGSIEAILDRSCNWQQAERLVGFVVAGCSLLPHMGRSVQYDRYAELRSIGVFIDPAQIKRLEVPVGRYLQTLGAAWAA
jgi:hypothetical protein